MARPTLVAWATCAVLTAAGSLTVGGIAAAKVRSSESFGNSTTVQPAALAAPPPAPLPGEQTSLPTAVNAKATGGTITRVEVDAFLAAHSDALKKKDRAGYLAAADPGHADLVKQQGQLFDNLAKIPFEQAQYQVSHLDGGETTFEKAHATIDVAFMHRIAGVDPHPVEERYRWTLARTGPGGTLAVTSATGTPVEGATWRKTYNYPAPWDAVPDLHVVPLNHVVLMADPKAAGLADRNAKAIEAAAEYDLGHWSGAAGTAPGFAVFLTADRSLMGTLYTGVDSLGRGNEVGLTHGVTGPDSRTGYASARIAIDSGSDDGYFSYDSSHMYVLFRHEMAHAQVNPFTDWSNASSSATAQDTLWAIEGFAEWTAESDHGPNDGPFAQDLTDYVAGHGYPKSLPADSVIYSNDPLTANAGYQMGQMAIRYMAKTYGSDKVDKFIAALYAEDGGATAVDDALKSALGTTTAQFTSGWISYLRSVA
jgi:hypothetical protein